MLRKTLLIFVLYALMTIEAFVKAKLAESKALREEVETIMSYTSPDDVMDAMITRDEFRTDLQKLNNKIADKIDKLESLKRRVAEVRREQATDCKKLENYKFSLLYDRKRGNV